MNILWLIYKLAYIFKNIVAGYLKYYCIIRKNKTKWQQVHIYTPLNFNIHHLYSTHFKHTVNMIL